MAPPGRTDVLVPARTKPSAREYALQRSHYVRGIIFNMQQTIILVGRFSVKMHSGLEPNPKLPGIPPKTLLFVQVQSTIISVNFPYLFRGHFSFRLANWYGKVKCTARTKFTFYPGVSPLPFRDGFNNCQS